MIYHMQLSLLIMGGGTGALTTIGCLIIFLILRKIGWKVSKSNFDSQFQPYIPPPRL